MRYTKSDAIWGGVLFAIGDTIAALILNQFTLVRLVGMFVIGATVYAFEIPNFFTWIEKITAEKYTGLKRKIIKTLAVVAFFNPLWIFRHSVFILLLLGTYNLINSTLLQASVVAFLYNIPFSFGGNYLIQNKVPLRWRFIVNAIFSALITTYYSLSPMLLS